MHYRFNEKQKTLAFGVYPDVSLSEAREKRTEAKALLKQGIDPSEEKKKAKYQKKLDNANTFETIAREWHAKQEKNLSKDYWKNQLHCLEVDIFPAFGSKPIKDIHALEVLNALQKIEKRGANEMARRCLQLCAQIFRYGVITQKCERDPTYDLKGALEKYKKGHYSALKPKELPEFLVALHKNEARLFLLTRKAIQMLMLTFVRTSELIKATWSEIDLEAKQWVIPASRMKKKREHIVPLSMQVIDILEELRRLTGGEGFIFPSQTKANHPMSNNTILKAIERIGYKGRMTGHGFRALGMTTIKEYVRDKTGHRFDHEVIDRQLAHAPKSRIEQAYNRAELLDDRTEMMQAWADHIDSLMKK
jgi:integrase